MNASRWKEIEELYHAAAEQDAAAREALFATARPEIAAEVRRLLIAHESRLFDMPALERETLVMQERPRVQAGITLGPYRVEASVGAGGMGEVFRASDLRLGRKVAIKAVRGCGLSNGMEAQILEEARAVSSLNHPNIVAVYDVGTFEGETYIVMEWVEGQTLRQVLRENPPGIAEALRIAAQVVDALQAAHEDGLIHRDLKPENLMLTVGGRLKVLDFGLAQRVTLPGHNTLLTIASNVKGLVAGTPGYMSPEQLRGEALDFRSDHFSFGAVLYELISGQAPFSGASIAEIQRATLEKKPEPVTSLNTRTPAPLHWLVERCLAKAARERYDSTEALRRDLQAIVDPMREREARQPAVSNVPEPRTALVGRETELAHLMARILEAGPCLVTLTGPGGIGKTRLAIELGRQLAGSFAGGVCFVQLDKINQAELVLSEVARALGVKQGADARLVEAVREHASGLPGPLLLLLDNFEHVLDAGPEVGELTSERIKIVVTSRAPLRLYGEYEFSVPPLSTGTGETREELEQSPAMRLFVERSVNLRAALTDEQVMTIARICRRLDGLPLALELAAARTRLFPLKTLEARLDKPLAVLVQGPRDLPARQSTLRATIDWSYRLLDEEHRKLFRRLAVFIGGATVEAIEAVCDTRQDLQLSLWDAIELLVENNLIRRINPDDAEPRFLLPEAVREYGLERLAAAGEEEYTHRAHAAYFLVMAEEPGAQIRRERTAKHPLDSELGNLRSALDWLEAHNGAEWGLRMVNALTLYLVSLRLHREGLKRVTRLLALPCSRTPAHVRNQAYFSQADYRFEFQPDVTADYLECWRRFEQENDQQGMFRIAHRLGFTLQATDETQAEMWLERAVQMARGSGQPSLLAGALSNLADLVKKRSASYARACYGEAMSLFESAEDKENAVWALSHQADLYRDQGELLLARSLYQKALSEFRKLGYSHGVASCLHDLAGIHMAEGDEKGAERLYHQSARLYGSENPAELPRCLESLAELAMSRGDAALALEYAGAAAGTRERFDLRARSAEKRDRFERCVEQARQATGDEAATIWMKGWNLSPEKIMERVG